MSLAIVWLLAAGLRDFECKATLAGEERGAGAGH